MVSEKLPQSLSVQLCVLEAAFSGTSPIAGRPALLSEDRQDRS